MDNAKFHSVRTLAFVSLVSFVAACSTHKYSASEGGYYDEYGNYIPTDTPHNIRLHAHPPLPGGGQAGEYGREYHEQHREEGYPRYIRRGYYDHNGKYVMPVKGINVPRDMFPPSGMCRIWFPDLAISKQPAIEQCDGINTRVPENAYVIYGG